MQGFDTHFIDRTILIKAPDGPGLQAVKTTSERPHITTHGDWQEALAMVIYKWEGSGRRNTTVTVQSVYSRLATGPIKELNQALTQAPEPATTLTPAPNLLPTNAPKKMMQAVGYIKA